MLLITSPHNFRYFTGLDSYFWESPTRPWFLLLSLNHDPIAIVPSIGKTALQKTWIKNIKTWQSPNPDDEGVTVLQETILKINKHGCTIGCEMGKESYLRMVINDFNKLNYNLTNHKFIDAQTLKAAKASSEGTGSFFWPGGNAKNPDFKWVHERYRHKKYKPI